MGSYLSVLILVLAAALQASVVPQIRFLGGGPDLVFLCVLIWSIHASLGESLIWALVGGIIQDLMSVSATGTSAVGLVLIVFAVNSVTGQVHRVGILLIAALVLIGSFIQQIVMILLLALTGFQTDVAGDFNYVVIPTVIYNMIFVWPLYLLVRWAQRRFTTDRRLFS